MRTSIAQSLVTAAMLGVSQGMWLNQYAQDFDESESVGEYFNNLAQQGRQCQTSFTRLYAEQPDIAALDAQGTKYTDATFLEAEAMAESGTVNWRRASEVFPESSGYTLFKNNSKDGISFHDIRQGSLGDCWVLSAIAALAEYPERIWNMFDQKELNSAGVYTIKMYSLGVPVSVLVDDFIPETNGGSNQNSYVKVTPEKELWPVFFEKAFAKLHGTYRAIHGGWPTDSALSMVGIGGSTVNHGSKSADDLWEFLSTHDSVQNIIQCACMQSFYGLVGGHAYTTLGVVELSNGVKLVKARNPWSSERYTGPWNDKDEQWTDELKQEAGMVQANDGTFFMPIDNYKQGFQYTMVNKDTSNWHHSYFLSLDNTTLGQQNGCGAKCRKNTFTIESETDQYVHIAANVHKSRAYVSNSCKDASKGYQRVTLYNGEQKLMSRGFHHTSAELGRIQMTAGQSLTLVTDMDWRSAQIQPDFAVTAWGEGSKVKISHVDGVESDHYPLQGVQQDSGPKPKPDEEDEEEKKEDEEEKVDPEEFEFEDFTDDGSTPENWCDAGIQIVNTDHENQKAIRVSHTCEDYSLKVNIGMKSREYISRLDETTEEHGYSLDTCKIDKKKRVVCVFTVPAGEDHALGMLMKSNWKPFLRYKYTWVKDE